VASFSQKETTLRRVEALGRNSGTSVILWEAIVSQLGAYNDQSRSGTLTWANRPSKDALATNRSGFMLIFGTWLSMKRAGFHFMGWGFIALATVNLFVPYGVSRGSVLFHKDDTDLTTDSIKAIIVVSVIFAIIGTMSLGIRRLTPELPTVNNRPEAQ
jgi:hypothetical protein